MRGVERGGHGWGGVEKDGAGGERWSGLEKGGERVGEGWRRTREARSD